MTSRRRNASHRLRLPLERERLDRLDDDGIADEQPRLGADERPRRLAAACSSRAATLTASPVTSVSDSPPTTTSPVLMPIRASSPCSAIAALISAAARTARSASSSCETGIPKTAMTASPTNFSTVPPWRSMIARRSSKYRRMRARSASGSVDSPSAVEPTRSQKRTVTTLRCSRAGSTRRERCRARHAEARLGGVLAPAARTATTATSLRAPEREARRAPLAIGVPRRRCPSARAGRPPARPRWPPRPGGPRGRGPRRGRPRREPSAR